MKSQNCPVCRPKLPHGKSSWVPVIQVAFVWNEQRLEWQFFPSTVLLLQEIMSIMKKLLWFHHEPNTILQSLLLAMGWFCFRFSILRINWDVGQILPENCPNPHIMLFKQFFGIQGQNKFYLVLSSYPFQVILLRKYPKKQETLII